MLLTKASLILMSSFILSIVLGFILIPILKRKANQRLSIYLKEAHRSKEKVPTMGGVIFIVPVLDRKSVV